MDPYDFRVQAWKDTLTRQELDDVERVEGMPPSMAMGFVLVTLRREMEEMHRPAWKQALAPLAVAIAAIMAYLAPDLPELP